MRRKMARYKIETFGNGAFWAITRRSDGASLFLQGDDAIAFSKELELAHERSTVDDVCDNFDSILTPDG